MEIGQSKPAPLNPNHPFQVCFNGGHPSFLFSVLPPQRLILGYNRSTQVLHIFQHTERTVCLKTLVLSLDLSQGGGHDTLSPYGFEWHGVSPASLCNATSFSAIFQSNPVL